MSENEETCPTCGNGHTYHNCADLFHAPWKTNPPGENCPACHGYTDDCPVCLGAASRGEYFPPSPQGEKCVCFGMGSMMIHCPVHRPAELTGDTVPELPSPQSGTGAGTGLWSVRPATKGSSDILCGQTVVLKRPENSVARHIAIMHNVAITAARAEIQLLEAAKADANEWRKRAVAEAAQLRKERDYAWQKQQETVDEWRKVEQRLIAELATARAEKEAAEASAKGWREDSDKMLLKLNEESALLHRTRTALADAEQRAAEAEKARDEWKAAMEGLIAATSDCALTAQRDTAIRERDEAKAEANRLAGEIAAVSKIHENMQADAARALAPANEKGEQP